MLISPYATHLIQIQSHFLIIRYRILTVKALPPFNYRFNLDGTIERVCKALLETNRAMQTKTLNGSTKPIGSNYVAE